MEDLGAGRARLGEEVRQGRPRRRHEVARGRGGGQLGRPGRRHAHLHRREQAGRQVDLEVVHEAEEPQQVGVLAEGGDHAVEVDRRFRRRLQVVVVRVLRDRERLQEHLRLGQIRPRVGLRRRGEGAVEGVGVHGLELAQGRLFEIGVERDLPIRGGTLVGAFPEEGLDRRPFRACVRVEGIGRDVELAHVPGGIGVELPAVEAL